MNLAVVVVAAGSGQRLGHQSPKALVEVAGPTLLEHALRRVCSVGASEVVVVHHPDHEAEFEAVCGGYAVTALRPGGETRLDSVRNGVVAVSDDVELLAIHDAARAFTPPSVFHRAVEAVRGGAIAAAPGLPVRDTLKLVVDGRVVATVPREERWGVQTPQVFRRGVFEASLAAVRTAVTDDLSMVELARDRDLVAGDIAIVPGSYRGLKVTYREDLELAAHLASEPLEEL